MSAILPFRLPRMFFLRRLAWLSLGVLLVSCGSDSATAPRIPADIILVPNHPVLSQGASLQLTATVVDANAKAITGLKPKFSSADTSIATVTAAGLVTSVGPIDSVRITAELDGLTTSVDLTVSRRIVSLSVTPKSLVLNVRFGAQLTVSLRDFLGDPAPTGAVTFRSSDTTIAVVTPFGSVFSPGTKTGTATISVTADTFTVQVPVQVTHVPGAIVVAPTNVVLAPSASLQLTVTVMDLLGDPIPSAPLKFVSSAPSVFSVSPTGLITSLGPTGSGNVSVSSDSLTVQVPVFVGTAPPGTLLNHVTVPGAGYASAVSASGEMIVALIGSTNAVRGAVSALEFTDTLTTLNDPFGVAINPAGTKAYVANHGSSLVAVVDLASNTVTVPGPTLGGELFSIAVSNDGLYVFAGTSAYVYRLNATTLAVIDSVPASVPLHLAVHPTQAKLYVSNNNLGTVDEVAWTTMTVTRTFSGLASAQAVVVASDGSTLYAAAEGEGVIRSYDLGTGLPGIVITAPSPFGLATRGSLLYSASSLNSSVSAFDRTSGTPLYTNSVGGGPRRLAVSSTGVLIVPNEGGWVDFIQ